jgi:hypothetical protein
VELSVEKVTLPVGEFPETEAVHVVVELTPTGFGLQSTEVVVGVVVVGELSVQLQ